MTTTTDACALADKLERPFPWRDDMIRAAAALRDLADRLAAAEADAAAARERVRELEARDDRISDAMQADFENGVRWLNERAVERFRELYPAIAEALLDHAALARQEAPDA